MKSNVVNLQVELLICDSFGALQILFNKLCISPAGY
jgi:hypothetical protein